MVLLNVTLLSFDTASDLAYNAWKLNMEFYCTEQHFCHTEQLRHTATQDTFTVPQQNNMD